MPRRKKSQKAAPPLRRVLWTLGAGGVVFAFLVGLWWGSPAPKLPAPKPKVQAKQSAPAPAVKAQPTVKEAKPPLPVPPVKPAEPSLPLVAIIIDDMGHSLDPARRLAALGLPLTFSILPYAAQAKAVARLAQDKGLEVMLHLPMEPKGYPGQNPGQGVLLCGMSQEKLLEVLREDLKRVPHAVGVNNHMGSRFSLRPDLLRPVLLELKSRGLFYLDSFTSADSQGLASARGLGLRTGRRDVFLDHEASREAIDFQMRRLLQLARERGKAVAIGHPRPLTMQALEEWAPQLRTQVRLVGVLKVLESPSPPGQAHQPGQSPPTQQGVKAGQ
ncbi:divergent polysaccharide deacetylase family protein [Desulfoferula mesophila]|uniref:Divergent polysaccharide deacetylase family protein n=1 Tax=Desulfoferula mesophila TaxID=3058419 RepID=A0AAU9EKA2_9BACT|nr:hypothetical protein FAK_20850 [Desulfoferula mesophilus]